VTSSAISPRSAAAGRLALPAAVGAAAVAATAAVAMVDPNEAGHYPACPFLMVTGLFCPGCGTLRAVHALTHGDVGTAIDLNVLTVALLPVLVWAWFAWVRYRVGARPSMPTLTPTAGYAVAIAVPLFWVARNLPWFDALAP
jgi:hypothetical protein